MGFNLLRPSTVVYSISVGDPRDELLGDVLRLINETARLLRVEHDTTYKYLEKHTVDYKFGGYSKITREVVKVIREFL